MFGSAMAEVEASVVTEGQSPRGSKRNPFVTPCHPSGGICCGDRSDQKPQKRDAASILASCDPRGQRHQLSLTVALLTLHRRACRRGWGPPDYEAVGIELIAAGRSRQGHRWLALAAACGPQQQEVEA